MSRLFSQNNIWYIDVHYKNQLDKLGDDEQELKNNISKFREEEIAKVKEELESERSRAQSNIQRERDAAIEELRKEFAGLAISAAEKVVQDSLDSEKHNQIIESVLNEANVGNNN